MSAPLDPDPPDFWAFVIKVQPEGVVGAFVGYLFVTTRRSIFPEVTAGNDGVIVVVPPDPVPLLTNAIDVDIYVIVIIPPV